MEQITIHEVAIIGAGGKMGNWFTTFFLGINSNQVKLYDTKSISKKFKDKDKKKLIVAKDIISCIKNADLILICVPIYNISEIIFECSKNAKPGAIISEISSIKTKSFESLINIRQDLVPLCIHPMFGPGAKNIDKMKIIVIPVRNKQNEFLLAQKIFEGASIIQIDSAEIHDKIISIVLGLTHYMNLVFAKFLTNFDYDELKKYGGTTFKMQSLISESIFTDNSQLLTSLLFFNPRLLDEIQLFLQEANKINTLISTNDNNEFVNLFKQVQSFFEKNSNPKLSYKKLYDSMKIIGETTYDKI